MELIYSEILKQEDLLNSIIWFLSFIIVFGIVGYLKKSKSLYIASIIFSFILIIKSINYFRINEEAYLKIYKDDKNIIISIIKNNEKIDEYKTLISEINELKYEYLVDSVKKHYEAITYINNKGEKKN